LKLQKEEKKYHDIDFILNSLIKYWVKIFLVRIINLIIYII
jgi:hypothetical protein